jgi:ElaB/YqjD/DUF883 family membrane-anchored ribosome-binding protein
MSTDEADSAGDSMPHSDELVNVSKEDIPASAPICDDGELKGEPIRIADIPRIGTTHLTDLVSDRGDIAALREEFFKPTAELARQAGHDIGGVENLLALTKQNSPLYITPSNRRKANWFADRFDGLELVEVKHTRGVHYILVGTPVVLPKETCTDEKPYSAAGWDELQKGSKYARILGAIDPQRLKDKKNPPPEGPYVQTFERDGQYFEETKLPSETGPDRGRYRYSLPTTKPSPKTPRTISAPSVSRGHLPTTDDMLSRRPKRITKKVFSNVSYSAVRRQAVRVEVWCEKGGVLPKSKLRKRYSDVDISFREAGGGQFSEFYGRCAVQLAKQANTNLVIVMLTDNDVQGRSMSPSVAQKVALEAALDESAAGSFGPPINAYVEWAGVRRDQIEAYGLPSAPTSDGETQVEVNSFAERHPEAFFDAICSKVDPYVEPEHQGQLDDDVGAVRSAFNEEITERFDEHRDEINEKREKAVESRKDYRDRIDELDDEAQERTDEINEKIGELNEWYSEREQEAREESGLTEAFSEVAQAIRDVEYRSLIDDLDIEAELSEPDIEGPVNDSPGPALLDTRRTLGQQADVYRLYDPGFRSESSEGSE